MCFLNAAPGNDAGLRGDLPGPCVRVRPGVRGPLASQDPGGAPGDGLRPPGGPGRPRGAAVLQAAEEGEAADAGGCGPSLKRSSLQTSLVQRDT